MKIPWAKPDIGREELDEVIDSFRSDWLSMGPKVKRLEQELSSFLNVPYAAAVSNGTVALDLALKATGVGSDDEVIVPAMTYFSTVSTVSYQHAVPVFVDIAENGFNLNSQRIAGAISQKTKAIIFIDYGGNPADYDSIAGIAAEYGIAVIQDGAQSLGGIYKNKPAGAQAQISTMSFHIAKVMTTVEGGMIFTRDQSLMVDILKRRNQGEPHDEKYKHVILGTNARMSDMQAAIGLAQMKKLPVFLKARARVADRYNRFFLQHKDRVLTVQTNGRDCANAYFFYPILISDRDGVAQRLRQKHGIDTRIAYPMPVYKQEAYASKKLRCRKMECSVAEEVTSRILNLPIFPAMSSDMVDYVCDALLKEIPK